MLARTGSDDRRGLLRARWAAIGAAVAVTLGGGGIFVANAATSVPSSVVTIDPVRILDTRTDVGLPGPFVSAASQKLQVTGAVVPADATGVLLNATVVGPTAAGFLSIRPGDATGAPSTSSLNFEAGDIVPNAVQVGLPTSGANAGQIDITYDAFGQAGPTTEVLIDVVGYTIVGVGEPGPAGPAGAPGADGSAIAYTRVTPAVLLDRSRTKNIVAVTRPNTGVYCLTVDPVIQPLVFSADGQPKRIVVTNAEYTFKAVSGDMQVLVSGNNDGCGNNLLEVRTFVGATASNSISFTVAVN